MSDSVHLLGLFWGFVRSLFGFASVTVWQKGTFIEGSTTIVGRIKEKFITAVGNLKDID